MTRSVIDSFSGEYRFLSNFYPSPLNHERISYKHVEGAYQAAKTLDHNIRRTMQNMTPVEAKRVGQMLDIRDDWEVIKIEIMYECLRNKFFDRVLRKKLLATGDTELIEGNYWGDTFWGVCKGVGENHLGKLLMKVRQEICEDS